MLENPYSLHRYLYAYANPTVWTDLSGRENEPAATGWKWTDESSIPAGTTYFVVENTKGDKVYYNTDASAWPANEPGYGIAQRLSKGRIETKEEDSWWKRVTRYLTEKFSDVGTSAKKLDEKIDENVGSKSGGSIEEDVEIATNQKTGLGDVTNAAGDLAVDVGEAGVRAVEIQQAATGAGSLIVLVRDGAIKRVEKRLAKKFIDDGWSFADDAAVEAGTAGKAADVPEGIVYGRNDLEDGVKPYVGQAKSESRYAHRQTEHARNNPDADFEFEELGRAEPGEALDVLEEDFIRKRGGPTNKGNPNGNLSNRRHQMSEKRYRAAGGKCDKPDCR